MKAIKEIKERQIVGWLEYCKHININEMKKILQLMKNFEKRNNISIVITFYSDGSSSTEEFWDEEELNKSNTIEELYSFLMNTQYKLADDDGRCLSPVQIL